MYFSLTTSRPVNYSWSWNLIPFSQYTVHVFQIALNLFKLVQTCPNWFKIVQIGIDLSKLAKTCLEIVQIGLKLSKFI